MVHRLTYHEEHEKNENTDKAAVLQTSQPKVFVVSFMRFAVSYSSTPTTHECGCIRRNSKAQATTPAGRFKILINKCYMLLLHVNIL